MAIIVNRCPPRELTSWRLLAATPALTIGDEQGAPEYQLFNARGPTRLANGSVVLLNAGTREIRFYGPDGRFLRRAGRAGGGPGEFGNPQGMARMSDDSIIVWDRSPPRATVFDSAGRFARTFQMVSSAPTYTLQLSGVLADASLLFRQDATHGPDSRLGTYRDTSRLLLFATDGRLLGPISTISGYESYVSGGKNTLTVSSRPFGKWTQVVPFGGRLLVADNQSYELRVLDLDGAVRRIIRVNRDNPPVGRRDIEQFSKRYLAATPADRRDAARRFLEEAPYPKDMPAFSRVRVDPALRIWVADYSPDDSGRFAWAVFDSLGHALGSVRTPGDFDVSEVGSDYVLGIATDEDDVQQVRMYPLSRPTESSPSCRIRPRD